MIFLNPQCTFRRISRDTFLNLLGKRVPMRGAFAKSAGWKCAILAILLCTFFLWLPGWFAKPLYAQTPPPDEAPAVHVVAVGESLSVIAQRYGISQAALMAENGITDPDAIRIGQHLRLPPETARPVVGVDAQYVPADEPAEHIVLPGETLLGIALRYGLAPAELMALNGIANPDHIVIGRRLRLTPAPATEPARAPEEEEDAEAIGRESEDTASEDTEPEHNASEESEPEAIAPEEREAEAIEAEGEEGVEEPIEAGEPADPLWTISTLNRRIHTGPGDTVARVALRYGVNEDALRSLNGLDSGSGVLALETELILPATRQELETRASASGARTGVQGENNADDTHVYHEIQPGESLGRIAQVYGLTLADLLAANRITDPNNILIGARLLIPEPPDASDEDDPESPVHLGRPARGYFFYTVQPGDTLSQLAREFNTTFLAILDYNNLPDPETVFRGVDLRIPFGPPSMPVATPPSPQSGTSFMISLSRQQCWIFQGDRVLHEWVCSTGYGEWITRTGVFAVQTKLEMAQSSYYELDMPYWLGIYDVGPAENGIHGLPIDWETGEKIWEGLLGQPATFGCAMLADDDAAKLFDLAYLGMPVYIVN